VVNLAKKQMEMVKLQNMAIAQLTQTNTIQQQYLQLFRQGTILIESAKG
jgi:hypothetical protein